MQRNDIETQTKKSVNDFSSSRPVQLFFAMAHLGVVDEEELERVCSERETALDRPLHHWEREALHLHLRNESLKAVSREERLLTPGFDKVICSCFGSYLLDVLGKKETLGNVKMFSAEMHPGLTILSPPPVGRHRT